MQIKRFRAQDMAAALKLVKMEFGCQAVILSAKEMKNGPGVFGFLKGPCVEITAATDTDHPGLKNNSFSAGNWSLHKDVDPEPVSVSRRDWKRPISLLKGKAVVMGNSAGSAAAGKSLTRKREVSASLYELSQEMQNQGVTKEIALGLFKELDSAVSSNEVFGLENIRPRLIESLKKMGAATKNIRIAKGKQKVIALIGPTGVGKTTTIAKLAAIGVLKENRAIGLISLDDKRIGAIAQLEVFARIMGVQLEVASKKEEIEECLKRMKNKDIILIDTPGISLKDRSQLCRLKDSLENLGPVEIHLLLSAVTREKDFIRILENFRVMPIDSLIFTKLDESSEYGDLLNQLVRTKIPVSYFTNGPQVPEDIEVATLEKLMNLILVGKKETRCESPRLEKSVNKGPMQTEYGPGPYLKQSYA